MSSATDYSVPLETEKLFKDGLLQNPLLPNLPKELQKLGKHVHFEGSKDPNIPINWRFAESIAAAKAFEATMLNCLLGRKYSTGPVEISIDTDHASLFFMSPFLAQIVEDDGNTSPIGTKAQELFPSRDLHRVSSSLHRMLATNLYKTKDGRFYHCHGSMNPDPTITALGLPLEGLEDDNYETVVKRYQEVVSTIDSKTLDRRMNEEYRQAGTIAWSTDEYLASDHGKANSHIGPYLVEHVQSTSQLACWWPENEFRKSSPKTPLAGLRVVDLTRVIAGPTVTRSLAEMGASVMRVTSPHITDHSLFHQDLNWGKWNCHLHLKDESDRQILRDLILDADVVVDGYRPGVMERLGFGRDAILGLVKDRPRGIIHVRENCYGWNGPWSYRSGWQQISDACCGVSLEYGRAMGVNEPVTPVFPNSDYCTGVLGSTAVLQALIKRAESGGSCIVDIALNYYSQWLVRSAGTYPPDVWSKVWERHGSPVFHNYHSMKYLLPEMMKLLRQHDAQSLFKQQYFESRKSAILNTTFLQVKPIAQFKDSQVELKYQVGTRGNGTDRPYWPDDLNVEVVS